MKFNHDKKQIFFDILITNHKCYVVSTSGFCFKEFSIFSADWFFYLLLSFNC